MLSFKDFIVEVHKDFQHYKHDFGGSEGYNHRFQVGPHHVHVQYYKMRDNHYSMSFAVNGALNRRHTVDNHGATAEHRHQIAHGVMGSARHFLNHYKPDSLTAKGNTPSKQKLYTKFWKHIDKTHPHYKTKGGGWGSTIGVMRRKLSKDQQRFSPLHNPNQMRLDV